MREGRSFIGTSGWSYTDWAKGRFYPKGLKQRDWLQYYAERFRTVELNASFYRLPKPEFIARWLKLTGSDFRFAVKLWRRITHRARLQEYEDDLLRFAKMASGFGRKRGPLLVQFPPFLDADATLLDAFLGDLRRAFGRSRWRVAVEFRNTSWLSDAVRRVLERQGAALCLSDMPRCPVNTPNDVPFVYMRRHGPGGKYRGCYPPEQILEEAKRVRRWLDEGRDVFVYFNNDVGGHAVDNAWALNERITADEETG